MMSDVSEPSARLLALLSLLQVRREWPGQVLAERLEISPRTVRRDVDRLRGLGYRIRALKGPDGGYRLEAGSELPPLLFDDEQAVAMAVALQLVPGSGTELDEAAARALATLRQVMPSRLRHRLESVQVTTASRPGDGVGPRVGTETLTALTSAVRAREVLRFDYAADSAGAPQPRRAEPHHVVARGGRFYLVAWDLDRADWRTFRVDRVAPRTPNGPRFAPRELPGGDVRTFVAARFKGSDGTEGTDGPDAWPCTGEAVLALPAAEVAPYAVDALVEDLGDGSCRLVMGSWSWTGLAAALARYDADVTVVGPPELRVACSRLARRFAAAGR